MTLSVTPGFHTVDHTFTVPLDHDRPGGEQIEVYAREVSERSSAASARPWLLYLQGGPGCPAPRPLSSDARGWLGAAVRDYRVLLLDQRGVGRSTPADRHTLSSQPSSRDQAEYLTHFRADAIVRDAEVIRGRLAGGEPWSVLGQSFGGFCALTYLSYAPQGLKEVFVAGGLPSLDADADAVYQAAYPRMERASRAHYQRYPEDVDRARRIAEHLRGHGAVLPSGMLLTAEAFQSLGIMLGTSDGSDRLHYLIESALVPTSFGSRLSEAFQEQVQSLLSFASRPLYALLHEAAYAQAKPTWWAAERVRTLFPQFDPDTTLDASDAPLLFTGETIHPWHYRTDPSLRPLRDAAHHLADISTWTPLYDETALAANSVPTFAMVYESDLYVDTQHSLSTSARVGALRTCLSKDHAHDGLAASGPVVFNHLVAMARGDC